MIAGKQLLKRTFLVSYATDRFERVRQELNESASRFGISHLLSYCEKDLRSSSYYEQNRSILAEVCGAGYWAWKPYFILQAMGHLGEGDILFYCDAGSQFIDSPGPLIDLCSSTAHGMVLFDARPLTNRQFTKRDCFVRMGCDSPMYWNANKVIATILVARKCPAAIQFVQEWLTHCCDRAAITDDPNICGKKDLRGFLQHRWDQAILSVLAAKCSLETFRNPTVWGNFLKLPQFRVAGEQVPSPYNIDPSIRGYSDRPQSNSPYGTLFIVNRQPNMIGKKPLPIGRRAKVLRSLRKAKAWLSGYGLGGR
jgi:hypothetical protein